MWWGRCSTGSWRRSNSFWILAFVILGVAMFSTRSFTPLLPIFIVLFIVLPLARRSRWGWDNSSGFEKPKRNDEKAKRTPRYVESDDGEMLEVIDEKPDDDADRPEYV